MKLSDFYFDLPEELIAQKPSGRRGEDKLMLLNRATGEVSHLKMDDLPNLISPDTLMVFNNSKVRRSRCYATKISESEEMSGREREFLFLNQMTPDLKTWHTMVKGAKKVKAGNRYRFADGSTGEILENEGDEGSEFRTIHFDFPLDDDWFSKNGHIPLPPYIRREDDDTDSTSVEGEGAALGTTGTDAYASDTDATSGTGNSAPMGNASGQDTTGSGGYDTTYTTQGTTNGY